MIEKTCFSGLHCGSNAVDGFGKPNLEITELRMPQLENFYGYRCFYFKKYVICSPKGKEREL